MEQHSEDQYVVVVLDFGFRREGLREHGRFFEELEAATENPAAEYQLP